MALVIILMTFVVVPRTPTDIFPEINIPVISLVWTYGGLQPQEMEQRITGNVERGISTLVNDVEHIESQSLPGIAVIKVYFQPNANIQTALAQSAAISQTFLRFLPPGTTPPLVIIYSASTVPVIQLGLTSDTLSEQQLFDFGNNFIRTQLATIQGAATPFPYGGKQRLVSVDTDSSALQAHGLSAVDIVNAVANQMANESPAKALDWAFRGGLAVILALLIFTTVNDLGSLGLWDLRQVVVNFLLRHCQ